jgi:hypothetical protein
MQQVCMRRRIAVATLALVFGGLSVLLAAGTATANVYATNLRIGGAANGAINVAGGGSIDLSFVLNENADSGVTLTIYRSSDDAVIRTYNLGALPRGSHTQSWDGRDSGGALVPAGTSYYFTVTAADDGYSAWTQISDDANSRNKYYLPTSVVVNTDPASLYYGRVYVGEGTASGANTWSGSPKVTTNGIYVLNADSSDAVGQGDTARTGGVPWDYNPTNPAYDTFWAPWHSYIAPDGRLIVSDGYDGYSGLFAFDPDCALDAQTIFAPAPWTGDPPVMPSGLNVNHGNVLALWVEGAGDDMQMYYLDEDYPSGAITGNVWTLGLGSGPWPLSGKPSIFISQWGVQTRIMNNVNQLRRDAEGNWFISQDRYNGTDAPSLVKVSADGKTRLWESLGASRAYLNNPAAADILMRTRSVAVDGARGRIAAATYNAGKVHILNSALDFSTMVTLSVGGTTNRDCAFDNVGNLYVVNSSAEFLKVYSPPDGPNSSTTRSSGKVIATSGDVTPPSAPVVSDDGVRQLSTTQLHATWTAAVDAESGIARYEYAVGYTPYDVGSYIVGWTNAGTATEATITGLSLKTGNVYYVMVRAVNGAGLTGPAGVADGIQTIANYTVGECKHQRDGTIVGVSGAVVTKKFTADTGNFFYIEDPTRVSGIKVVGSYDPTEGNVLNVIGTVRVAEEMYIQLDTAEDQGPAPEELKPVGMSLKALGGGWEGYQRSVTGGSGANNIGLYVKVWGMTDFQVTDPDGKLYVPINDGSVAEPVSCYSETVSPPAFTYSQIWGISSIKAGKPIILMTHAEP